MVLWGVVFYTSRRLQQTAVSCKRSICNKIREKSWKSHVWGFIQRRQTTGFSVLSCRFARKLICGLSLNYYELNLESLHCHQLEEELDDWCQYWYFQNGTGLSRSSPHSRWRRCNLVNASLKSERSFNGPDLPELLREIHQFFLYRKYSACVIWQEKSFCASSTIRIQTSSLRSCSSWDARNSRPFKTRSRIPSKRLLMHLFLKLWATWKPLFCGFPISIMMSSILNYIILNWEKVQCTLNGASVGFTFFQEMPAGAMYDALTPIQ